MNRRTNLLASTIIFAFLMVFGLMFLTGLTTEAAPAASFIVDDSGDSGNNNCGDANCTLRDAIVEANASPGADTIVFNLPANSTITLNGTQLPAISEALTIIGTGEGDLTVSAANLSRIFEINAGQSVTITGMTIRDGSGGSSGGAVYNKGSLLLQNMTVISSTAASGGAVYNTSSGALSVDSSTISENIATFRGGGIYNQSGSVMTLTHSTISGNSAVSVGGALFADTVDVSIMFSSIQENSSTNNAGGYFGSGGTALIGNSTFYSNTGTNGGAITIQSTIVMTINNSTLSDNSGTSIGAFYASSSVPKVHMSNTIIANSLSGSDCFMPVGALVTNINNLIEDGSCTPTYTGDPDLGLLMDNGGDTWTMMPVAGSPLIDAGDNGSCEAKDQRGVDRPIDGDLNEIAICDIGAVEAPAPLFTVTKVADTNDGTCDGDCSLREAVAAAASSGSWAKIDFSLADNSTITLTGGQITISSDVTIDGSTAVNLTVSGNNNNRVFNNSSNISTTITSVTISDGLVTSGSGGGISNAGRLALYDSSVINSAAERGGGIDSTGTLIVDGSLIAYNLTTTNDGGGIAGSIGQLTVTNSTLYQNTADGAGGGLYVSTGVTTTINNSTFSGNSATSGGGIGAAGTDGLLHLQNTIIANSTGSDCSAAPAKLGTNTQNLIEDGTCTPDFSGDPDLGSLQDNGGETLTMVPQTGSLVIDNGQDASCEATDQRGVARPEDGDGDGVFDCDIGAVEVLATTFTVNKTADTNDGVCSEADCSLREAVGTANAWVGANKVRFSLPSGSTITLGSQLPVITDTLTIDGSTAVSLTVSGDNKYRVFEIGSGTTVTMTNMTLANGDLSGGSSCPDACGAGILNGGQLALDRMIISNNDAYQGGGVYVAIGGVMTMTQGDLMHNSATDGGGIYNWGRSSVNLSTISNNTATNGGGVYNTASGWIESIDVTIKDNLAGISGGGIYNFGKLTLRRNTVFNNGASTANGVGGGVYILQTGQLTMTNSTVSSNSAFWGGGVANTGQSNIRNSTLSDNLATVGGGLWNNSFGVLYFSNSIIANSQVGVDCSSGGTIPVSNNINNLVETGNCSALFSADPKLQPLDYYGGETRTQAIPVESPAYNKGDNVTCEAKDQRGVSRPQDGACDIGAFEYRGGTSVYLPLVIKQ